MTFLQLCQMVQRYTAAGSDLPGTAPTTTVGQTGYLNEIVNYVQDAYQDIQQMESNWLFRQGAGNFTLTNGTSLYTKATIKAAISLYERILPYRNGDIQFIAVRDTSGSVPPGNCYYVPFDKWGGVVANPLSTGSGAALPTMFTVQPDESLLFSPTPNTATMHIAFQYIKTVQTLGSDSDVPIWPSEWHDAIAWRAIKYWAFVRESATKFQLAEGELQASIKSMRANQLFDPQPTLEAQLNKDAP